MSDDDGFEEFGGLARWCEILLRYSRGRTEPYRLVAIDGQLPQEFKRPLDHALTTYERFVRSERINDGAIYEWSDIEEN
jgi:hypothetical protein